MCKIINSLRNSFSGLVCAFKSDKSIRIEFILLAFALVVLSFVKITMLHKVLMLGSLLFVIVIELINTALEKLADKITTDYDESIKYAKDVVSAAVLIALIIAALVCAYCIFF